LRQHFDRHVAAEFRIAGTIDLAHPAGAEQRKNAAATNFTTEQIHWRADDESRRPVFRELAGLVVIGEQRLDFVT
jgi:hypothetical protein